ncbi:MAG: outer membrane protein assembly factor BamD, partial [Myxococcaceae bacterium]
MTVKAALLLTTALSSTALAQSAELLEAVRIHKPDAVTLAQTELAACEAEPSCSKRGVLSLLTGYLLLSEGEAVQAVSQLEKAAPPAGLEPFHAFYLGNARFYSRDYKGAAEAFGQSWKKAPPSLLNRAGARYGEALLLAGKASEAVPPLEQAASIANTPELLSERAQARQAVGNQDGARADLRALVVQFPAHPYADEALAKLSEKGQPPLQLTLDEHLQRARGFLDAGQASRALSELNLPEISRLAKGSAAVARVAFAKAQALYPLGREAEANDEVEKARKGQPFIAAEAMLLRAKRVMRTTDNVKAMELMAEVDKKYKDQPAADEAGYFVGWLDLQGGRYADAVKAFDQFSKRHPDSRKQDEALWFKSLALIRMQEYGKAAKALDGMAAQFSKSSLVPQARYWATRSRQLSGSNKEDVQKEYAALIEDFPATFYAALASARLKELGAQPPAGFPAPPKLPDGIKVPDQLKLARRLSEAGLFRDALEEVNQQAFGIKNAEEGLQFAEALQTLGEYGTAYAI